MTTAKEIRESFKLFFSSKGHEIVSSAPMVIKNDPTLMFINAGMNQFKNIILGNDPIKFPRVADTQKCLRVSGKHNDLEEVGYDTYHHTMFEMLGNWSFGDYFKQEAIDWAWEYLTEVLKLDKNRLYVTVYEGSKEEKIDRDNEAAVMWSKYVPEDRIINGNKHDNFWEMGDTGPCGPCSEIHIDLRSSEEVAQVSGASLVNADHPQVVEIWNLVFMQFNRMSDGHLEPLPCKVIDTGMGFERLCMAVQNKTSNYDTDIFQPILKRIGEIGSCTYGKDEKVDIAMRVIADHVRTIAFSIADGQLPSNVKAGYVIRRILRRAVRYGYTFMNQRTAFMYRLIPTLIESMGDAYSELKSQEVLISKVMKEEEESFLRALDNGIHLLDKVMLKAKSTQQDEISGVDAFMLFDTYGFPLDLTELILKENGLTLNVDDFATEMQKQKNRARNAAAIETGDWVSVKEGKSNFIGYNKTSSDTQILRYRKVTKKGKDFFQVVLSETPFYAEMGGQVGDTGTLKSDEGEFKIYDTKKENNLPVHLMTRMPANVEALFVAHINTEKRKEIEANHTATHLLHDSLREVLGNHVEQKGSYVSSAALRFDFSHFEKIEKEDLVKIEHLVNKKIRQNISLKECIDVPIEEAQQMGAVALFGEKYGDFVRVIQYGSSVELCGGTHVSATGNIGLFKITSESSIAAGIRRIEAVTAEKAELMIDGLQNVQYAVQKLFNNVPDILSAAEKTLDDNCSLRKKMEVFAQDRAKLLREDMLKMAEDVNGVQVIRLVQEGVSTEVIKGLISFFRGKFSEVKFMLVIATVNEGKPNLNVFLSQPMVTEGYHAGKMIRDAAKFIQGGGGGQAAVASAGGKYANGLDEAVDSIMHYIE